MKRVDKIGAIVRYYTRKKKKIGDSYYGSVFDKISSLDDELIDFLFEEINGKVNSDKAN